MKQYLADLHIHTCLSPCGSLEMSPSEIVRRSLAKGLDAIAITDHNTTLQCPEIQSLGERFRTKGLCGRKLRPVRKRIVWFISRPMNPVSDSNDI